MNKDLKVDKEVLFFAFRYALGRMSYAPTVVMDNIKENIKEVNSDDLKLYIKEINECEQYGMEMDERHWLSFKGFLEEELKKR